LRQHGILHLVHMRGGGGARGLCLFDRRAVAEAEQRRQGEAECPPVDALIEDVSRPELQVRTLAGDLHSHLGLGQRVLAEGTRHLGTAQRREAEERVGADGIRPGTALRRRHDDSDAVQCGGRHRDGARERRARGDDLPLGGGDIRARQRQLRAGAGELRAFHRGLLKAPALELRDRLELLMDAGGLAQNFFRVHHGHGRRPHPRSCHDRPLDQVALRDGFAGPGVLDASRPLTAELDGEEGGQRNDPRGLAAVAGEGPLHLTLDAGRGSRSRRSNTRPRREPTPSRGFELCATDECGNRELAIGPGLDLRSAGVPGDHRDQRRVVQAPAAVCRWMDRGIHRRGLVPGTGRRQRDDR
jgi:hypothetical protein